MKLAGPLYAFQQTFHTPNTEDNGVGSRGWHLGTGMYAG
jgi:hypothetical protein